VGTPGSAARRSLALVLAIYSAAQGQREVRLDAPLADATPILQVTA